MSADKELFKKHLSEAPFQSGIDKGHWEIQSDLDFPDWPKVVIRIKARKKNDSPDHFSFRFDLGDYPATAPNCCIWDEGKASILEAKLWPKGQRYVSLVFNPAWRMDALYSPCERYAIPGHEAWKDQHPEYFWKSDFTILIYLQFIRDLLNSDDYASG